MLDKGKSKQYQSKKASNTRSEYREMKSRYTWKWRGYVVLSKKQKSKENDTQTNTQNYA